MTSSDVDSESGRSSPVLASLNSSSALILVHDEDESLEVDHTRGLEDAEDDDEDDSSYLSVARPYIQPLTPSTVLLYLLAPYLKLGAILLPNADLPLKLSIPLLLAFAVLAAFARQIWYLLSRYLRKGPGEEDVLVDAFSLSKGSRIVRQRVRELLRSGIRVVTGTFRLFLATTYLREGTHMLLSSLPSDIYISNWVFAIILAVIIYPFIIAQSLGSKRVVYTTWASIAFYISWFFCVVYAHAHGAPTGNSSWLRMGSLWEGITTIAFTFTSSSTLTLYTSLKANAHVANSAAPKTPLSRSFKLLSIISVALAVCFTFPLLVFAAFPNKPQVQDTPSHRLGPFILASSAITLLLGIPLVLNTTPPLPIPERLRRTTTIPLSKTIIFIIVAILSLVPVNVSRVYSDILIVCALGSTYFLPALVHITTHFFKRPLSIIMPTIPSTPNNSSSANFSSSLPPLPDSSFGSMSSMSSSPNSANDPLLQRKEFMMQRKQFGKRIIWDIGVWTLLLPVGGGGFIWAVGRIAGQW
ncbi:hypothetical protein J3R30DRAFT_3458271 [Lentinula aciculospora]|uniref:Uncharacterized protein n=1 Tax=Lentinula aciculospora TaxID=153920 RepID=A0A9W9AHY6_9AGAR|nr:hypothetical protein J3R30DRAFT_3458271 [Lentinula aciculospora]